MAALRLGRILPWLRWETRRYLRRRRWAYAVAAFMVLGAVAIVGSGLHPEEDEIVLPTRHTQRVDAATTAQSQEQKARGDLDAFYRALPAAQSLSEPTVTLLRLGEKHGLRLGEGEYHTQPDADAALVREEIVLPVEATPAVIQAFLREALQTLRPLTVRAVSIERDDVNAEHIKARIHFVILARAS